jgi:hypothetical protein
MMECRYCDELIPNDEERVGARCPRCREPIYERREASLPASAPEGDTGNRCTVHPANLASGTCQRCGNFVCRLCRTRWHDRALCLGCLERLMESQTNQAEDPRAHRRQATLSVVFGLAAWLLVGLVTLLFVARQGGVADETLAIWSIPALICLVAALFGVGQGAAAVRARGPRMILATSGLVLSGAAVGIVLGMFCLSIWGH